MTARSHAASAIFDAWVRGRRDPVLVEELSRLYESEDLLRLLWFERSSPGRELRLELVERVLAGRGRPLSPLERQILVAAPDQEEPPDLPEPDGPLDRLMIGDGRAQRAHLRGRAEEASARDAELLELLAEQPDPVFRYLVHRRLVERALDEGLVATARRELDRLIEGLPRRAGPPLLVDRGVELLKARLQEAEDDPDCLWSYLALSRDLGLLESDRQEATLRAAELMSRRHRIAGALALQLELVHGRCDGEFRRRALRALVRDMIRGGDPDAARGYAESLVAESEDASPQAGEGRGMAALTAIRAGDALAALDHLDRAVALGCDPALVALVETIEARGRGDAPAALVRARAVLAGPPAPGPVGPWRSLLAVELLGALRRQEHPLEARMQAAEMVLQEAAHARDLETMRDAHFSLALLLAETPADRERALAACREAESLTRMLLEAIDADREILFRIMPRNDVIRTVVSSLMGRITEHARRGITQLVELGASLARDAARGRDLLEALQASQQRVSRLLEAMPIVIWTSWGRARDFALASLDGAAESLLAVTTEELLEEPRRWFELVAADDRPAVRRALEEAEERLEGRSAEFRLHGDRGETIWIELQVRPILGDIHGVGVLHGFMSDVTARRRLQENIQRVQKLEGLGRLAHGLTHDFNNLLGSILSAVTLLMQSDRETEDGQELLQVIEKAAVRGTGLMAGLRGFARSDDEPTEVVDLAALARETVELGRSLIGRDVQLVYDGPERGCFSRCRRAAMTQAILELLSNAREAEGEGRSILVAIEADDDRTILRVVDQGRGMDYETRTRAFDPFFGTKDPRRHRGLGLTMVYKTMTEMGGTTHLRSEPGRGTAVTLALPRADAPVIERDGDAEELPSVLAAGRLLLIDDDPEILRVSELILAQSGFEVVTARDGREGLELFRRSAGSWTLVVSDIRMPLRDGLSLVREIRGAGASVPVLLMSGYTEETPAAELARLAAVALIRKPFTASAFRAAAGRLLRGG